MKVQDRLKGITRHIKASFKGFNFDSARYPRNILDLVVFHKIHLHLDQGNAAASYERIKTNFVDWNEIRISSILEIQEALGQGAESLAIAVFVKDLLDFLHKERQILDMEFLAEEPNAEIRRFLKLIKGIDPSTVNLVLRLRKEYPVLPIEANMEPALERLGLVRSADNREQKGKFLHSLLESDAVLPFHHFFLDHSREVCPPDESQLKCPTCGIRSSCDFFERARSRAAAKARARQKG